MGKIGNIFTYVLLAFIYLLPFFSNGQTNGSLDFSVAEKIYLQLGSEVYASDQEIWFKAIVVDSQDHLPTKVSGVLYVDLINPNGQIIEHRLIKLTSGLGHGSFDLDEQYPIGRYLIRAYTQWNRNFGNDFIFENYVDVVAPESSSNYSFMSELTSQELETGGFLLTGKIAPLAIESIAENRVPIYLNFEQGKDTIEIKKMNGGYSLAYEVPRNSDWVTITLGGNKGTSLSETIMLKKNALDVQFFPESGQLVHGFPNKMGVKVLGADGKGSMVDGKIFDQKGQYITTFSSNHLGMGAFRMRADSSKTYHAKVFEHNDSTGKNDRIYPLPKVTPKGSIISLSRTGEKLWIRVSSNSLENKVYIKISCRGRDYFLIEGPLQNGLLTKDLPLDNLPGGILVFTLMDQQKRPVSERLFYNPKDGPILNLTLQTDKKAYGRRERTELAMKIPSLGTAAEASLSVFAINKNQFRPESVNTIRSYFLLDSEIRGEIEDPDYYYRERTPERFEALDALLLTQGWRNYNYPVDRKGKMFFWPEPGIEVKGSVQNVGKMQKGSKNINLSLVTFGKETKFYTSVADSLGRFGFLLDDDNGSKLNFLLSAKDDNNKSANYKLHLRTITPPKAMYDQKPLIREPDTLIKAVVQRAKERKRVEAVFDSLFGVTQLDEVVVTDRFLTPEIAARYEKYGEPDVIISGDEIRAKEKKWSYGLFSILLFNYGDQVEIEQFPDGFMLAHIRAGSREPTLLMVDGKLIEKYQYELVPHMSSKIVERVELIKYAKFFKSRYLQVFPETNPLEAPSLGHIISITTKGGVGLYSSGRPAPGTLTGKAELFSPIKQFYAPKYDKPTSDQENKPDLRSLVHWEPLIFTDRSGNASTSFYNNDILGNYIIIVEAISSDGRIGYGTTEYFVEESAK